jgi:hypothetical protein
MKKHILSMALMAAITLASCTEKKQGEVPNEEGTEEVNSPAEEVDNTGTDADTAVTPKVVTDRPAEGTIITVTGQVVEINQGKDGYSAKIKTADGKTYVPTISIPNMADPKDYRAVKAGETITVTGEAFPVEEDIMIKVTKLHK